MIQIPIKEQAKALREQGLTYKEISSTLNGAVSVDWCKRQLKGIVPINKEDNTACLEEIIKLGERSEGITYYEANRIIHKHFPDASEHKVRYIKEKAKSKSKDFIIHSGWIDHMKPNESHKAMNAFALHLMDQLDLMVEDYIQAFPNSNKWSVRYEMLKLAFSDKISKESLKNRVYTNELLVERMEEKK